MTNYKLRGRIIEHCGSVSNFSRKYEMSRPTIERTLSGSRKVPILEMLGWCYLLDIPTKDAALFFSNGVDITNI